MKTKRSKITTKARIQLFCRANNNDLGYLDGERVFPRSVTDRKNSLFLYNNRFCLTWKSERVIYNQAFKKLEDFFKVVDNYITEENVKFLFEYIYQPKKIQSHLTNLLYTTLKHIIQTEKDHIT